MKDLYDIAMLWVEGPISFLEQLCVQSFLDAGHTVTFYHYGDVPNVPAGANKVHGSEILDIDHFIAHEKTGSMALFSDVFRYHLLTKRDRTIWADTDAYCMKPFVTETGHYFAWEGDDHINGGVLGLPQDSEALAGLLDMTKDEYAKPFWYRDIVWARIQKRKEGNEPLHVSELPWGVWGPHAVTAYLQKTGEDRYAMPSEALYPIPYSHRRWMARATNRDGVEKFLTEKTTSIHLYGRRMRSFVYIRLDGIPEEGSLIHSLLDKHKVDYRAAPILETKKIAKEVKSKRLAT